ncbi:hypothetical protein ABH935_002172 [Catenulispora sp. GAS73]|uniref:hypothetical protein n=1 Tax=Catenulispora sp. GAS73 TaxID=3156269 RepID=UPI0035155AC1
MTRTSDTVDVPVVIRHTSLDTSWQPGLPAEPYAREKWTSVPDHGDYLIPTTWRELLLSAFCVGRDLSPWIRSMPDLAVREIISRRFLLEACLERRPTPKTSDPAPPAHATGFEFARSKYHDGAIERSGRGAFSYLLGMTMADWAGRRLLDLGPTTHAESGVPYGASPTWSRTKSLPDLFAYHRQTSDTWLVEAKGGRTLNVSSRRKGAAQLDVGALLPGRHTRALCATGMTKRLSMMIDIDNRAPQGKPGRPTNLSAIQLDVTPDLALVNSGTLIYLALSSLPHERLAMVTVNAPQAGAEYQRAVIAQPMESEPDGNRSDIEMLVGTLPGSDLKVGISSRLYETCGLFVTVQRLLAGRRRRIPKRLRDRVLYGEHDLDMLVGALAEGFGGEEPSWESLIETIPASDQPSQRDFLEVATQDIYIATEERA